MRVGRLDQRVTLERFTSDVDEIGQPIEAWTPYATVWAAVEPLNGREFIAAQAGQSEVATRIRMRYRQGVLPPDRIVHDGKFYDITAVINPKSGNVELVLMCKSGE